MGNNVIRSKKAHGYQDLSAAVVESSYLSERDFKFEFQHEAYVIPEGYGIFEGREYGCMTQRGYHYITNLDESSGHPDVGKGYKLHISLSDFDATRKAWDRMVSILMKYNLYEFKVRIANPVDAQLQPGKSIVLYHGSARDHLPWGDLLNEIETVLKQEPAVTPGPKPCYRVGEVLTEIKEPLLEGSEYMYASSDTYKTANEIPNAIADQKGPFRNFHIVDTDAKPAS